MNFSPSKAAAFRKYEFKKLCHLTGFSQEQMDTILNSTDANYKSWSEKKKDKKTGLVKTYKDGTVKKRTFRNPSVLLKEIQLRIYRNILSTITLPENVHGGVKGRSNITNAKAHQGNKYLFGTDLIEFYPSIKTKQVFTMFREHGFSPHLSDWLAKLTTTDDEVPQGAPTSTCISNLVFYKTDIQLAAFCTKHQIIYTRYVDDLTFSSQQNFALLIGNLLSIITARRFKISYRKTDYSPNQLITGIKIFLHKIDGSDKIIEKAKEELLSDKVMKPVNAYLSRIRKTNKTKR